MIIGDQLALASFAIPGDLSIPVRTTTLSELCRMHVHGNPHAGPVQCTCENMCACLPGRLCSGPVTEVENEVSFLEPDI